MDHDYFDGKMTNNFIHIYYFKATFEAKNQLESNFVYLTLYIPFSYWFIQMNQPRLTEYYSTRTLFTTIKDIGENWYAQMLCGKKPLFWIVNVMGIYIKGVEKMETSIIDYG